jgi:hypothetical protein
MSQLSIDFKQHILSQYIPHQRGSGFKSLAHQYNIAGGGMTIKRWYDDWNGSKESLRHKKGAGRPPIMNQQQIIKHIKHPLDKANQSHTPINYRKVLNEITNKTNLQPSIRTVQNYGEQLKGKKTKGIKRTAEESKIT